MVIAFQSISRRKYRTWACSTKFTSVESRSLQAESSSLNEIVLWERRFAAVLEHRWAIDSRQPFNFNDSKLDSSAREFFFSYYKICTISKVIRELNVNIPSFKLNLDREHLVVVSIDVDPPSNFNSGDLLIWNLTPSTSSTFRWIILQSPPTIQTPFIY